MMAEAWDAVAYLCKGITLGDAEDLAVDGHVLGRVEILPEVEVTSGVFGKPLAADELALRQAAVGHLWLEYRHRVVLKVVVDLVMIEEGMRNREVRWGGKVMMVCNGEG